MLVILLPGPFVCSLVSDIWPHFLSITSCLSVCMCSFLCVCVSQEKGERREKRRQGEKRGTGWVRREGREKRRRGRREEDDIHEKPEEHSMDRQAKKRNNRGENRENKTDEGQRREQREEAREEKTAPKNREKQKASKKRRRREEEETFEKGEDEHVPCTGHTVWQGSTNHQTFSFCTSNPTPKNTRRHPQSWHSSLSNTLTPYCTCPECLSLDTVCSSDTAECQSLKQQTCSLCPSVEGCSKDESSNTGERYEQSMVVSKYT